MFNLSTDEITDGPIHRALLVLAAPLLVQNAVRMVEQIIDLYWVGHYSGDAVAAIGLAGPLLWFLLTTVVTTSFVGTQVLVSQRVGADNALGARRAAFTGLVLTIVLSAIVGGIVYVGSGPLLEAFTSFRPGDSGGPVIHLAQIYLQVLALGVIFAAVSDVFEAAFIGWGDSRASLYLNVSSVLVNLALDPVLIFGYGPIPALGMRGAALATVGGWFAGFLLAVALMAHGRAGWIITRASATLDVGEFRELLDIGLPAGVRGAAATTVGMLMVILVFATAGGPGLAAYTVGSRVRGIASRATNALKQSTQSIVGQNLGADKPERAGRTTWIGVALASGVLTAVGALVWLYPASIVHVLVPDMSPEGVDLSVLYLRIITIAFPAMGALKILKAGLNGARRTKTTMVASLAVQWGIQLPIAVIGGIVLDGGIEMVFWSWTISTFVGTLVLGAYFILASRGGLFDRAAEVATADPSPADD